MIPAGRVYTPRKEYKDLYDRNFEIFKALYKQNRKLFAGLNKRRSTG
jgi:xylulokinase